MLFLRPNCDVFFEWSIHLSGLKLNLNECLVNKYTKEVFL